MIEDATPPLEFRSYETANLSAWRNDLEEANFLEVAKAVSQALDVSGRPQPSLSDRPRETAVMDEGPPRPARKRKAYAIGGTIVTAPLVLLVVLIGLNKKSAINRTRSPSSTSALASASVATAPSDPLPKLTYGTWTLHNAFDDEGANWSNSVIRFTSQEEAPDGLVLRGMLTWRLDNVLMGTEEFTGRYVARNRQVILDGSSVKDVVHPGPVRLAVGSYSAVVSSDERTLVDGRWGVTAEHEPGLPGRWEALR